MGRPGCKDATPFGWPSRGQDSRAPRPVLIKPRNQPDLVETLKILEGKFELPTRHQLDMIDFV